MPPLREYDPSQVSVNINGALITNFNTVRISRDEDSFIPSVSTSGHQAHAKNANKGGNITLVLPQTSLDNNVLGAFDLAGTTLTVSIIDRSSTTVGLIAQMSAAHIMKAADAELGKDGNSDKEWSVIGDMPIYLPNGN